MIDAALLLKDLQRELGRLSADLFDHVRQDEEVRARLESEWRKAFDAERTGRTFEDWLDDRVTQVGVAWLLALVFVRFCEDNQLVDESRLGGTGVRGGEARDAQQRFFAENPHLSDRDYVHQVLRSASVLRGLDGVIGEGESPLWLVDPPADAVTRALALFRITDEAGDLRHDFTDPDLSTRFLGDLYQDLSEHAKSTYALLQTPEFVEEFILDRTLTPAIETFGLAATTMIDPTCGSGHFLLGGFHRIFNAWRAAEPGVSHREHAERSLGAVTGVDLNPFAAAIARFRLLVAALVASDERRLADTPALDPDVTVGDSLLWAAENAQIPQLAAVAARSDRQFIYATEHADDLLRTFSRSYSAVVGNPPYIIARDRALNSLYRDRYPLACSGKYSLAAPFMQCFFELASSDDGYGTQAGYVGMITANSFMKREFGKRLVQRLLPTWDITHVIDTAGAHIPGHGTPTVILLGRHQGPRLGTVRVVMGITGEPSIPDIPSQGLVWNSIVSQIDLPGSESQFVSVADSPRERFQVHPWSIGGGGAADLKQAISTRCTAQLGAIAASIGPEAVPGTDEALLAPERSLARAGLKRYLPLGSGDVVRDFGIAPHLAGVLAYDMDMNPLSPEDLPPAEFRYLWRNREVLASYLMFGKVKAERKMYWSEWGMLIKNRVQSSLSIAFASVSANNHFALDRGGRIFKQSAPVIILQGSPSVDDYLNLVGLLNSSVAAFWVQQTFHDKGNRGEGGGICSEAWERFFDIDGTKLKLFPLPAEVPALGVALQLDANASDLDRVLDLGRAPSQARLDEAHAEFERLRSEMIALHEELDWICLDLYGVTARRLVGSEDLISRPTPPLNLGERAFEIVMARRMAAGELETAWFQRHGSTPITDLPAHWPDWYRDLVNERIRLIETDRDVGLVERPEHKRRWAREPWEKQQERALREWLQDRLEARALWFEGSGDQERAVCRSIAQLADRVLATDPDFLDVARLWKGVVEVDPVQVVTELVAEEHVPAQSGARYKGKGFDKRGQWVRTWELQKLEDNGQALPEGLDRIPVPPKYTSAEFAKPTYWRHRGKLDVPKERFTSIWGAESEADGTMLLAWAGFDHVQLTQAIGAVLVDRQQTDGWDDDRSWPLVVAMAEQLFWLDLWHNDHDPRWGDSPANLFRSMVTEQANRGGRTPADAADWRAPALTRGRKKKDGA